MHSKTAALFSIFALSALAKPLGPIESIPDGTGGDAAIAAGDQLAAHDSKGDWDLNGQFGPKYLPLSINGNDCFVHNMIGIHDDEKAAVKDCVANNDGKWGDQNCADFVFSTEKVGGWTSSQECFGANKDCLNNAIDNGFESVECHYATNGFKSCRVKYHHDPLWPSGDRVRDPSRDPPTN